LFWTTSGWLRDVPSSLILAQLNRSSDNKELPEVSDISDSSSIENNSDVIILGHRPEKLRKELVKDPETGNDVPSNNRILWLYEKNRGGKTPHILGRCDVAYNRFWNSSHTWDHNYIEDYKDPNFWKKHL
jgi:replicative DNA helicase